MTRRESWTVAVMPEGQPREPVGDAPTMHAALELAWREIGRRGLRIDGTEAHMPAGRIRFRYSGGYVVVAEVPLAA